MKPKIIAAIVVGLIAAGVILQLPGNSKSKTTTLPTPVKQATKKNDPCFSPKPAAEQISLDKTKTFGTYEVRLYWDSKCYAGGIYEILKDGQILYSEGGGKFHIGTLYTKNDPLAVQNGQDITGDGIPDLVITEWSGGAHCCMTVRIFQIGEEFKLLATIKPEDGDSGVFEDMDGDSSLEFKTVDFAFAYFPQSFAGSSAPKIVLRYSGQGGYRFAMDLMRVPPPTNDELTQCAEMARNQKTWITTYPAFDELRLKGKPLQVPKANHPQQLWQLIVDLIYTGNEEYAWKFFNSAWPENVPGKDYYVQEFNKRLHGSQHWNDVQILQTTPLNSRTKQKNWLGECRTLFAG